MGERRKAREAALQLLYQAELSGDCSREALQLYWGAHTGSSAHVRAFAEELVTKTLEQRAVLDKAINDATENWELDRIARIDLSLLRLAACELLCFTSVPAAVIINEAVEIARKYSDNDAAGFVNGVLDRVARDRERVEKV